MPVRPCRGGIQISSFFPSAPTERGPPLERFPSPARLFCMFFGNCVNPVLAKIIFCNLFALMSVYIIVMLKMFYALGESQTMEIKFGWQKNKEGSCNG